MQRHWLFVFVGLLLSYQTAAAQSTWHGLRYGETTAEASADLKDFSLHAASDEGAFQVYKLEPLYRVEGQKYRDSFPFEVRLLFRESKLAKLDLRLDVTAIRADNPMVYLHEASEELYSGLKDKYGEPSEQKGTCPISLKQLIRSVIPFIHNCDAVWRTGEQNIEMRQQISSGKIGEAAFILYFVDYSKASTAF